MRGKGGKKLCRVLEYGITPAYAGKRFPVRWNLVRKWDHPRLCGEKYIITSTRFIIPGSPPPMRGKVDFWHDLLHVIGITPAYAGKSVYFLFLFSFIQDHPRLCGEKRSHPPEFSP